MFDTIADYLIARAKKTPYWHIKTNTGAPYMDRWWLIPYKPGTGDHKYSEGTYVARLWKNPIVWLFQKFGWGLRVHEIRSSDDERAYHDHPWPFLSVVLKGGYCEHEPIFDSSGLFVGDFCQWHGPGSVIFHKAGDFHRLELTQGPATTLFLSLKKRQHWGFMPHPETNKVYYRDYRP